MSLRASGLLTFAGPAALALLVHCTGKYGMETVLVADGGDGADGSPAEQDSSTPSDDGAVPSDAAIVDSGADAFDAGPACDVTKPFGLVKPLMGDVNTAAEETYGRISDNGLELYFARAKKIFRATRASISDPWSGSAEVVVLNRKVTGTAAPALSPTLTGDGLTMFLTIYDDANVGYTNVYSSTRASTSAAGWTVPTLVPTINGTGADDGTWVSRNGLRLYFHKGPPYHVVVAERTSLAASFGAASSGVFTGNAEDRNAVLSEDELTGFFSNYTFPPLGAGAGPQALRTYVATRASTGVSFATASYSEVNIDSSVTEPTWLSKDGCTILLHSARPGAGSYDLFYAVRPK